MAKLDTYRAHVQQVIRRYGEYKPAYGDVEVEVIFDVEHDHYQLVSVGWNRRQRIHGCILHLDIKGEKIWVQHDGTESGIAKEDIVLAFHAPYKRQYTGFAVN